MTDHCGFISMGLDLARRAVLDVFGLNKLHLESQTLPRSRRAMANGRLKQIECIVRRLILLLALSVELAPPATRDRRDPAPLPDGVELAMFPHVHVRRLTLMPAAQAPMSFKTWGAADGASTGSNLAKPLLDRIRALQRVLRDPDAAARRLARTIQRLKARGEPRPLVGSVASAFRLGTELGAVSTALPGLVTAALETWESSG
jgi:hypothetical protein